MPARWSAVLAAVLVAAGGVAALASGPSASALREQGCALAQGYLFSRPLPEAKFTAWLDARSVTLPRPRRRASARQRS
jgi:predicted signal transduction protein with EAL and GGDEF domain